MQNLIKNPQWMALPEVERAQITEAINAIAARFAKDKVRSYDDCMGRCAEMQQAMMEHCQIMGGDAAAAACAIYVEHAIAGCYKSCHESHGVSHGMN